MHLLDSNTFIEAKNRYYHMDVCPGYWAWILDRFAAQEVASIRPVFEELAQHRDELSAWAGTNRHIFLDTRAVSVQQAYREVAAAAVAMPNMQPNAAANFLAGADPWLIAKAIECQGIVVTHETFDPNIKKRIKIPNICRTLGVPYMNTFELLLGKGAEFVMS